MQIAARQTFGFGETGADETVLVLRVPDSPRIAEIARGVLASGSGSATVDWGDGSVVTVQGFANLTHAYSAAGDYRVVISNDLAAFGYADASTSEARRQMLLELVSVGSKIVNITAYGFNNCRSMRGVIELPSVKTIESYAFGSTAHVTEYRLPEITDLESESFYSSSSATAIYADKAERIAYNFVSCYGRNRLRDLYVRRRLCAEIAALRGFPFGGRPDIRFHCADGILFGDGNVIRKG